MLMQDNESLTSLLGSYDSERQMSGTSHTMLINELHNGRLLCVLPSPPMHFRILQGFGMHTAHS